MFVWHAEIDTQALTTGAHVRVLSLSAHDGPSISLSMIADGRLSQDRRGAESFAKLWG